MRAASLAEVKSVYLFPMANGLDQYLADRLTQDHIFQVVTDPKAADAVITDRLGVAFETQLLKVRPDLKPVPPPKPVARTKTRTRAERKGKKEHEPIGAASSFHAANGTVFLVACEDHSRWSGPPIRSRTTTRLRTWSVRRRGSPRSWKPT